MAHVVRRQVVARDAARPEIAHNRAHHRLEDNKCVRPIGMTLHKEEYIVKKRAQAALCAARERHLVQLGTHAQVVAATVPIVGVRTNLQERSNDLPQHAARQEGRPRRRRGAGRNLSVLVGSGGPLKRVGCPDRGDTLWGAALDAAAGHRVDVQWGEGCMGQRPAWRSPSRRVAGPGRVVP